MTPERIMSRLDYLRTVQAVETEAALFSLLQIMDVGWPELHAPPLDKMCTICKAQESWLNSDPQHVVVIHCRVSVPAPTCSEV